MAISIEQDLANHQAVTYLEELFSREPLLIPSFPDKVAAMSPKEQIPLFQAVRSAQYGFRRIDALTKGLFPNPEPEISHPLYQYREFWIKKAIMHDSPLKDTINDPPLLSAIPMIKAVIGTGIYKYYHILELHKDWVTKRASGLYGTPILKKYYSFEDVYDLCFMGLMRAAAQYDPSFNATFLNFSALLMLGSVYDNLRVVDLIPRSILDRIKVIEQQRIAFELDHDRIPSLQELSELTGLTPQQMETAREKYAMGRPQSLTAPHPQNETENSRSQMPADVVAADQISEPEWNYLHHEERYELIQWIQTLPDRLQQIVFEYYVRNRPFKEIGDQMGISEARVAQLNLRALSRLRSHYPDARVPSRELLTIQQGFGKRLRQMRQIRGMSISELSRRLHGTRSMETYIWTLEFEKRRKSNGSIIRKIMRALRLTPEEEHELSALIK